MRSEKMEENSKNRKVLIGSVSLVSAIALVAVSIGPSLLLANEENSPLNVTKKWDIIVPDQYKSIREAVENAQPGDRIFVRTGNYPIRDSYIRKPISVEKEGLTIHGEDKETTIINGKGLITPVIIKANDVSFSGFTLKNNGINGSIISISSDHCTIDDNILTGQDYYDGTEYCIRVNRGDNNIISNNTIFGTDNGIELSGCTGNIIENNTVKDNYDGIELDSIFVRDNKANPKLSWRDCTKNIFLNNLFTNNNYGIHCFGSYENLFFNNTFDSNKGSGLYLAACNHENIINNTFIRDGLSISGNNANYYFHEINGNTVNGKPIYYYKREHHTNVPKDAGQIILVECNYATVENVIISETTTAVLIAFSNKIKIRNSEFSSNNLGIFLSYSEKCIVEKNNFINNSNDATFVVQGFLNRKSNKWRYNYWDSWLGTKRPIFRFTKKRIHGRFHVNSAFGFLDKLGFGYRTKNFDRFPRKTPYAITA